MIYKKISTLCESIGKISAVMIAPSLVFSTTATNILFFLTAFLSLLSGNWRIKFNQIVHNPITIAFLLFYLLLLIGVFYSTAIYPDIIFTLHKYDKFLFAILFIPFFAEKKWRDYAINAFLLAIFIMLIISISTNSVSTFKDTIAFNFLMAFAVYMCLHKATQNIRFMWFWLISSCFITYTVLFRAIGRSGYFVFAGLLGLFFIQKFRWRGLLLAIVSIAIIFSTSYTFSSVFKRRTNEAFQNLQIYHKNNVTSVGSRLSFLENSIKLIKKHPLIGTGTGSFVHEYAIIKSPPTTNPHNEYIYITVQFGIVGLLILLLFFMIPAIYSRSLTIDTRYIAQGTILSIMLGCLANSWLLDTTEGHFYAYFLILAFASFKRLYVRRTQNQGEHAGSPLH
jgi:O-antigen ligase